MPEEEIDIPRFLVNRRILGTQGTQNRVKCIEKKVKEKEKKNVNSFMEIVPLQLYTVLYNVY